MSKPLIRSTSNRQFSGRTDSLSPKAIEQVKKEIPGGDSTPALIVKLDETSRLYLVKPTTKLQYDLSEIDNTNIQTLFNQIEQDYPFLKFESVESVNICKIIGSFKVDLILCDDTMSLPAFPVEIESWIVTGGNCYSLDEIFGEEGGGVFPLLDIDFDNISDEILGLTDSNFHLAPGVK